MCHKAPSWSDEHAEIKAKKAKTREDEGKSRPGLRKNAKRDREHSQNEARQGCDASGRWRIGAVPGETAPIDEGKGSQGDTGRDGNEGDRGGGATPAGDTY